METYKNLIALTQSMAKFDDFNNKSKSSEDLLKEAEELYAADENDLAKILKNVDKTNLTVKSRKLPSGNVNLSYMDSKGRGYNNLAPEWIKKVLEELDKKKFAGRYHRPINIIFYKNKEALSEEKATLLLNE